MIMHLLKYNQMYQLNTYIYNFLFTIICSFLVVQICPLINFFLPVHSPHSTRVERSWLDSLLGIFDRDSGWKGQVHLAIRPSMCSSTFRIDTSMSYIHTYTHTVAVAPHTWRTLDPMSSVSISPAYVSSAAIRRSACRRAPLLCQSSAPTPKHP